MPAVTMDDPLHRGETNSRAREFSDGMHALKSAKLLIGVCHIKANAIVAHKV